MRQQLPEPIFTYSTIYDFGLMLSVFLFVFFLVTYTLLSGFRDLATSLSASLVGLLTLYESLRIWLRPVRKAAFHDDQFELAGWGLKKKINYSEVEKVTKSRKGLATAITLFIRNEARPFVLFKNPSNEKLRTDLYTWLIQKKRPNIDL